MACGSPCDSHWAICSSCGGIEAPGSVWLLRAALRFSWSTRLVCFHRRSSVVGATSLCGGGGRLGGGVGGGGAGLGGGRGGVFRRVFLAPPRQYSPAVGADLQPM